MPGTDRKVILVVDDDPLIRQGLCELLEDEGYDTMAAGNGREALERLRGAERPRAILLDLRMPVMDGLAFREQLQRDPALKEIPIVVISCGIDARRLADGMAVAGFLRKPIHVPMLIHTVESLCPLPGGAVAESRAGSEAVQSASEAPRSGSPPRPVPEGARDANVTGAHRPPATRIRPRGWR